LFPQLLDADAHDSVKSIREAMNRRCAPFYLRRTVDAQVKDRASFEQAVARAFAEGRRVLRADDVSAVVFAHKTRPLRAGRRCWLA
jgi:hypothetical protein